LCSHDFVEDLADEERRETVLEEVFLEVLQVTAMAEGRDVPVSSWVVVDDSGDAASLDTEE
jgi:hypothetical protein